MTQTAIIECPSCKGLMLANSSQKTKTCPYCGSRVEVLKAKQLANAETAMEASAILRKLKTERQSNPTNSNKVNQQG